MRTGSYIGQRIRVTRETKGISQNELADLLGISSAAVCLWETKGTTPRAKTLKKIAEALEVSENYLVTGAEAPPLSSKGVDEHEDSLATHIERVKRKIAEVTGVDIAKIALKITFED